MTLTPTAEEAAALDLLEAVNKNTFHPLTNPNGLAGIGYKTNIPKLSNATALVAPYIQRLAAEAATAINNAASIAVGAPTASSSSVHTIASSGTKVFTTDSDLVSTSPFQPTMWIKATSALDASKWMFGYIPIGGLDYAGDTITMTVTQSNGTGSVGEWFILATGPAGAAAGIGSLAEDLSPQLGGDLSTNGHTIFIDPNDAIVFLGSAGGLALDANGNQIANALLQCALETFPDLGTLSNAVNLSPTAAHHYHLTLGGNVTITPPATLSPAAMRPMVLWVKQPATGGPFTVSWASSVKWIGGAAPAQSSTAGATDIYILQGRWNGTAAVYAAQVFGQGWVGL